MTNIYLIRHGEAEGNLYRRMQGQYDGDLTVLGYRQVEALSKRFQGLRLDAVYSSDLYRAMRTAAPLCLERKLPLYTDSRLREVNVGPWEDRPFGDAWRNTRQEMEDFAYSPLEFRLEGAETFRQIAERGCAALSEIAARHPGGTVAVCAHNYLIRAVLSKTLYGFQRTDGYSVNTAVSLLKWEGTGAEAVFLHDGRHLDGAGLRRVRISGQQGDMAILPMGNEIEQYIRYRKDAWQVVYGSLREFDGSGFWMDAQRTMGPDPYGMVVGYLERTPVGMIQLSPERDKRKHVGYIPFIYLREQYRHKGLGIQLIGHAVSFYRKLGRTRLQLSVAPSNEKALGFYHKYGFKAVGKNPGRFGRLILMEKDIALPALPKELRVIPMGY